MEADERMDACIEVSEELAAEGYRFYAREASEFAEASAGAVAEALELRLVQSLRLDQSDGLQRAGGAADSSGWERIGG